MANCRAIAISNDHDNVASYEVTVALQLRIDHDNVTMKPVTVRL